MDGKITFNFIRQVLCVSWGGGHLLWPAPVALNQIANAKS
jgi:hypothetical protein